MVSKVDKNWEKLGAKGPCYSVASQENYLREREGDESYEEFLFKTGEKQISNVLSLIKYRVSDSFCPTRSLDFGCGVGRHVVALSKVSNEVLGVDIAESMLKEAKKNIENYSIKNEKIARADDNLPNLDGSFDLIYSYGVFQHIPSKRGLKILCNLLDCLSESGICVIHIPYFRSSSYIRKIIHWGRLHIPLLNNIANLIKGKKFSDPMIFLNIYNLNQIFMLLNEKNINNIYIENNETRTKYNSVTLYCMNNKKE